MNPTFLKTKDKKYFESSQREMPVHLEKKVFLMTADCSPETMEVIRKGQHFLSAERKGTINTVLYPVKISFRNERAIRTFSEEAVQRIVCSRTSLKEWIRKFWKQEAVKDEY